MRKFTINGFTIDGMYFCFSFLLSITCSLFSKGIDNINLNTFGKYRSKKRSSNKDKALYISKNDLTKKLLF